MHFCVGSQAVNLASGSICTGFYVALTPPSKLLDNWGGYESAKYGRHVDSLQKGHFKYEPDHNMVVTATLQLDSRVWWRILHIVSNNILCLLDSRERRVLYYLTY